MTNVVPRPIGLATERLLAPPRSPHREQPYGPRNGRSRADLVHTSELKSHQRKSTIQPTTYPCRDHGRRAQVKTWPRLPMVPPRHPRAT